jgi:hypothetical protein
MSPKKRSRTVTLGDLVARAFERAGQVTSNPHQAATLAGRSIARWLEETRRQDLAGRLMACAEQIQSRGRDQVTARAA